MDTRAVNAHLALTETAAHLAVLPVEGVHEQSHTLKREKNRKNRNKVHKVFI